MSKRLPSQKKLNVMNSDSYLFSIKEASLMLRKNTTKFVNEYLKTGKINMVVDEDGRIWVPHFEIKKYQQDKLRTFERDEYPRLLQNQEV